MFFELYRIMKYLLIASLLFVTLNVSAQTKIYKVYKGDSEIGQLAAVKVTEGNGQKTHYQITSELTVKIIISINSYYTSQVTYVNDVLNSANAKELRNDDIKRKTTTEATSNGYNVKTVKEALSIEGDITFSDCLLQFIEPIGISKIYSESLGTFATIKEIDKHKYLLTSSNGDKSEYQYQNGECVYFKYLHPLASIEFRLQQ